MALANVELTNTFDEWRTRTNQIIVQGEQTLVNVATLFTRVDNGNLWANSVGTRSNTYSDSVGVRANTYSDSVGNRANTYADTVGLRANTYANSVGIRANTYSDSVGLRANTYADSAAATEAALARSATNLTSGTIPVARVSGNYNLITGLGTISSGTWQGSTIAVDRGGTGVTSIGGIQTALGLGSLAYLSSVGTANLQDNSVNGAKIALGSDTTGDVMYFNGTDWVRLPAGTSGQLLRTSGTGGAPYWFNAGMTYLGGTQFTGGSNTPSSYPITLPSLTNYRFLHVLFRDVDPSTGTSRAICLGTGTTKGTNSTEISAAGTTLKTISVMVELTTGWAYSADSGSPGGQCYITNATTVIYVSSVGSGTSGTLGPFGSLGTNAIACYGSL